MKTGTQDRSRQAIRRLLSNDWLIVILLFVTAASLRWIFFLYHPRLDGFLIYQGSPLSDGCSYTFKAISIAQGHGIPTVQQPAVRPFYPIALACFYTWTGFSLWAVTLLNIIAAGFTTGLIYLCGTRAINRFCGLGAALFFAIDPSQLMQAQQAGTEPLGLLFFVASVYAGLRAFEISRLSLFLLTGIFIALSNLTRTLTILTLPFYAGLIMLLGVNQRAFRRALFQSMLMVLGCGIVLLPWVVRQAKTYGIASISDNIGEAIYAATSPKYKEWTPLVRQDADADRVRDTIGDRYRYFIREAGENLKRNPGFYLRNVGTSLWQYANTFNSSSRASPKYEENFSRARKSQRLFQFFIVALFIALYLLRTDRPFTLPNLTSLAGAIGLSFVYLVLPGWLGFLPIIGGVVLSWRAGRTLGNAVLFGSLAMAALGSAVFGNPTLFRAILMTDWLFLLYFLAAVWFPVEALTKRTTAWGDTLWREHTVAGGEHIGSDVDIFAKRAIWGAIAFVVGFFAISSVRLIALTVANPPRHSERQLPRSEVGAVLRRLQKPPFEIVPIDNNDFRIFAEWNRGTRPQPGQYVALVQKFDYYYYIPPGKMPPRGRPQIAAPYVRSLVILPQLDFTMPGEIPRDFREQPLIFVGIVITRSSDREQLIRPQVEGLAVIPFNQRRWPDYTRAVCSPASAQRTRLEAFNIFGQTN